MRESQKMPAAASSAPETTIGRVPVRTNRFVAAVEPKPMPALTGPLRLIRGSEVWPQIGAPDELCTRTSYSTQDTGDGLMATDLVKIILMASVLEWFVVENMTAACARRQCGFGVRDLQGRMVMDGATRVCPGR
jgi:hypothetical protein